MKTAAQGSANWQASAGRAATDWQAGINGYTGDWAAATTGQYQAWVAGLAAAQASGAWQNGVNAVGTAGWKSATVAKAANYTTGFQAGASKQSVSMQKLIQALQGIVPGLPPRGTFQQNVTRSTTLMADLHALRGQLKG
jgi:hypothetical protein